MTIYQASYFCCKFVNGKFCDTSFDSHDVYKLPATKTWWQHNEYQTLRHEQKITDMPTKGKMGGPKCLVLAQVTVKIPIVSCLAGVLPMKLSVNPINYVNPVCCVATVCQVRCIYWGHLGHFHRVISHSKWYKIVFVRYLACKFSQMKSINMFSMFLQSGVPRHFLRIESTMTMSMEDVSTGVLEKIKNIWKIKIKPKMIWCIKTYIIAYVKKKKKIYYQLCQAYSPTGV